MNFYKRSYQLILRYLYTETIKRQDEILLHRHFNINITSNILLKRINSLLMQIINSFHQNSNNVLFYILQFQALRNKCDIDADSDEVHLARLPK